MKLLNISTRAASLSWLQSVKEQIGLRQGSQSESVFELIKMSEESLLLIRPSLFGSFSLTALSRLILKCL